MAETSGARAVPWSKRHRWLTTTIAVVVAASVVLLALVFIPANTVSKELQVSSSSPAGVEFSVPGPAWVTVHFDHRGSMGMTYWMDGPTGMMFNHSMMSGSDAYSFATWGGSFWCGVGASSPGFGMMPVWVNMTWGLL